MFNLWNYLKACIFGNELKLVDQLIEIIEIEKAAAKVESTPEVIAPEVITPKPRKPRKKKTDVSTN